MSIKDIDEHMINKEIKESNYIIKNFMKMNAKQNYSLYSV